MKIKELIEVLQKMDPEAVVYTNCCEATPAHEEIDNAIEAGRLEDGRAFVGSCGYVTRK